MLLTYNFHTRLSQHYAIKGQNFESDSILLHYDMVLQSHKVIWMCGNLHSVISGHYYYVYSLKKLILHHDISIHFLIIMDPSTGYIF